MTARIAMTLSVNGRARPVPARPDATLLDIPCEDRALRTAGRGCNRGVCGTCTVTTDGLPVRSCPIMAGACEGRAVPTPEGHAADPALQALQEARIASGEVQCGFCTAGVLAIARSPIARTPRPSGAEIRATLSANLCRCTGHVRIAERS